MINKLLNEMRIISTMVDKDHIRIILMQLQSAMHVEGDVVELGCHMGTTSLFIQSFLQGRKSFHVYDSFQGFPEKNTKDIGVEYKVKFYTGGNAISEEVIKKNFKVFNLQCPIIHKGWFKDSKYPEKIAFAFFDSDFYTSILDSFEKVYPKLSPGGIICVHDYGWDVLPGVKTACDEFLADKSEKMIFDHCIGILIKQ
jgi:O-methyltransferase